MKKFIKKTLLFLFLFVVCNFLYLWLLRQTDWNFRKRIEALSFDSPTYELLVLGNSLPMDGIDTEFLSKHGIYSYNLSIDGASIKTSHIQLMDYLSRYEYKPKYVILGLGSYMTSFEDDEIHPIVEFTSDERKINFSSIPLIKFNWLFTEQVKKLVSKVHRDAYLQNGQLRFNKQVADNTLPDTSKVFPLEKYKSSTLLYDIIRTCSTNGIKIFIVEMPGFKKTRHKKSFNCLILDKASKNGFLLDYNSFTSCKIFDDKKDWIGNSHLNINGAKKLTKSLMDDMELIIGQQNQNCN